MLGVFARPLGTVHQAQPAITCFPSDDEQYLEFVEDMSTIQPQKKASRKVHLARHSDGWVSFHVSLDDSPIVLKVMQHQPFMKGSTGN